MFDHPDHFLAPFDAIRQFDDNGAEFWSGRDLCNVLQYSEWGRMEPAYRDVYTSLQMENPNQSEMVASTKAITIGYGAVRIVPDWRLSQRALNLLLQRVAGYKPMAALALGRQQKSAFRIEIDLGVWLADFCHASDLTLIHQKTIGNLATRH